MIPATQRAPSPLRPMPSLGAYLVVVMLVATVPLALMLAYQLFGDMQAQQRRLDENLQRSAAALAASVERDLATTVDALTNLSRLLERARDDRLPALQRSLREHPRPANWQAVYLRGPDGQLRFHSGGRNLALPALAEAMVSDMVADEDRRGTVVEVPVVAEGGQRYTLGAWIDAAHWQRLVDSGGAPEGGTLSIAGRDRRLIARSAAPALAGQASRGLEPASNGDSGAGVQRVALPEGGFAYSAEQASALSGWGVSAHVWAEPIESAQRRAVLAALAITAACLLLGVALATLLARRITDPLIELATRGPSLPAPPVVREIAQLRDALAVAQEQEAQSRAHLQRKADEFQALFAGTPVGLAYLPDAPSGRVLHNAAMVALVGPPGGDAPVQAFEHGQALPADRQPLQRAVATGQAVGPLELELRTTPAGPSRHVLVRAVPLLDRDQRPRGAVAAMVEITERKLAEQRLLETDQRLRQSQDLIDLAQEAGDVGFFQFRFDTRSGTWTPGQARLWGFEPAHPPPSPDELLQRIHAADRELVVAQLRTMIESGHDRATIEFRIELGAAAPRWLSTRVLLAFDADQQPRQMVGVSLNVTEHKHAERERAVLIAGEQAARLQAEAASRAKDEFLAMLGHELRNPLGAIGSAVEVLNRVDAGTDLAVNARLIIGRQTRHLAHLMDDLLDVGRVISGKVLLATRRLELGALVERVVANFDVTGESRRHDLRLTLERAWVEVDPTRIEQVLTNLLGNAFKYTPAGRRIDVLLIRREARVLLEVRDQGPGIAAALLPRVFDLFVQGERPIDRPGGGLGIGLTLVRRLVELHGGHVTAHSSSAGTTFQVSLRAVEAPPDAAEPALRGPAAQRRVLVVEDNADLLSAMRSMLELEGHAVSTAIDGERGLALLLGERPDAAIVDIGLPGLSGYDLAKSSRRAGYAGKLFAMSGYGGAQDVAQARRHGFDAHLAKPVDPQRLHELLARS